MDSFGLKFYTSTGLVSWGTPYGTELVFKARETTGGIVAVEPWTNDVYVTEGGYSAQAPRRTPRMFTIDIQLLDARTLDKIDKIHTAVSLAYRCEFRIINGYLIGNASQNTLANNAFGFTCTLDVGQINSRDIHQAGGVRWKKDVRLIIRESLTLTRPNPTDIIVVPPSGGSGQ